MAFKTATVNASDVPATLTNYPSYIDWSRLGITTLAEAQSSRVYADSGKVVEWAREVVSATEGHTKVPSLTSTTPIYVDYDGVRADYAVTDTYGRNAAWSSARASYQLNESSGNATDSTGNGYDLTNVNSITYGSAYIGNGASSGTGNTNKRLTSTGALGFSNDSGGLTLSCWYKSNTALSGSDADAILSLSITGNDRSYELFYYRVSSLNYLAARLLVPSVAFYSAPYQIDIGTTDYYHVALTTDASTMRLYVNGVERNSVSLSGTGGRNLLNEFTLFAFAQDSPSTRVEFGDGTIDNVRAYASVQSANWITTEYNNQSDEAGFWGTWTDAGGGVTRRVFVVS